MIGFTRDESFSDLARAVTLEQYRSAAERQYGSHSSSLLELHPASDDASARRAAVDAARENSVRAALGPWAQAQASWDFTRRMSAHLFSRVHPYVAGVIGSPIMTL